MSSDRLVVVLCGPPGAGKTTVALDSGLEVFDRDDDRWLGEKHFRHEVSRLRDDATARAVVIRSGASSSARAEAAALVGASCTFLVRLSLAECRRRVWARGRSDARFGLAAVGTWFDAFDDVDGVTDFPGWDAVRSGAWAIGNSSRDW